MRADAHGSVAKFPAITLNTAKVLGLTIPQSLLVLAGRGDSIPERGVDGGECRFSHGATTG